MDNSFTLIVIRVVILMILLVVLLRVFGLNIDGSVCYCSDETVFVVNSVKKNKRPNFSAALLILLFGTLIGLTFV